MEEDGKNVNCEPCDVQLDDTEMFQLFDHQGAQKIYLPHTPGRPLTVKQILSNFQNMDRLEKSPKEVTSPELQKVKNLFLTSNQIGG